MLIRPLPLSVSSATAVLMSCVVYAGDAFAHHPMGGKTPSTFMEGFLSGIGHPVIGPDHLAFIVAIGIAAAFVPAGLGVIAAFIAASTLGVLLHTAALNLPLAEQAVALSVVVAGGLLAFGRGTRLSFWPPLAALAGLFHGFAFGETVVGAERTVVGAYLVGIAIIASIIAAALMMLTARFIEPKEPATRQLRAAGVMLASIGVVLLAGSLVSA